MIKILFVHSQLVCGGAEQALFDLATQMDKTKYKITILVQFEGGVWEQRFRDAGIDVRSPWSFQRQTQNPFVKLHNLYKRIRVKKAMDHNGEDLLTICLNENFDIIVSYGLWFMQQMCFAGEAKTVKFIHGDMETDPKFCKNIMETLPLIRRFDRIICVSERARKSFCEITGITNNVSVHFNPLNSNNIRIRSCDKVLLPNDLPLICAVGRLVEEKGFARLICIHKRLVEDGMSHRLIIIGDGREKERLISLIQEIHAEDSVIMVGYKENPYPYIAHSKFLICSSYTEGMGIVAMEALLLGIPVVSSAPSVGELFGEEFCGIITGRDDQSLESGIRCMLENSVIYEKAKLGAERRGSFFDGKRMTREIEEEFLKLIAD